MTTINESAAFKIPMELINKILITRPIHPVGKIMDKYFMWFIGFWDDDIKEEDERCYCGILHYHGDNTPSNDIRLHSIKLYNENCYEKKLIPISFDDFNDTKNWRPDYYDQKRIRKRHKNKTNNFMNHYKTRSELHVLHFLAYYFYTHQYEEKNENIYPCYDEPYLEPTPYWDY